MILLHCAVSRGELNDYGMFNFCQLRGFQCSSLAHNDDARGYICRYVSEVVIAAVLAILAIRSLWSKQGLSHSDSLSIIMVV